MHFMKKHHLSSPKLHPSQMCILAGAGISLPAPSSFPTAAPVLRHVLRDLANGYATSDAYLSALDLPPVNPRMEWEYMRFEFVMDRLALYDPKESFLREVYSRLDARPNSYHIWLANMLSLGANVITTNFDLMIEHALGALRPSSGALPSMLLTDEECDRYCQETATNTAGGVGTFQKLHGSVDGVMAARFPQLVGSGAAGPRYQAAAKLIHGRTLLVLGYSGGDDFDVMPMLSYMYAYKGQPIIWIEHAASTEIQSIPSSLPPPVILQPEYTNMGIGQLTRIQGDSVAALNFLCHESCPSLGMSVETSLPTPLPALGLTDWERLSLVHELMQGNLYVEQAGIRSAIEPLLPKVAEADGQSKSAAQIHQGVWTLIDKENKEPAEAEIISAIANTEPVLRRRLENKILLLEAWLEHKRGAVEERDQKLRTLMAWCDENANWEVMTSAPDWAFCYCEDLREYNRRGLYLKVGWHLMIWSRDLQIPLSMMYIVEDAESFMNEGGELDYSYWDYQKALKLALFYNQRLGNVKEARNAAANLRRVAWVWNQFDEHRRYSEMVKELDEILSRHVPKLSF
jgi:SIR2-like domain